MRAYFDWQQVNQEYQRVQKPKAIPLPPWPKGKEEQAAQQEREARVLAVLKREAGLAWSEALQQGNVEEAWKVWNQVAESPFLELCEDDGLHGPEAKYR